MTNYKEYQLIKNRINAFVWMNGNRQTTSILSLISQAELVTSKPSSQKWQSCLMFQLSTTEWLHKCFLILPGVKQYQGIAR